MKLDIFSKYKIEVDGEISSKIDYDNFGTFPIRFEQIGLTADDVIKYLHQLVVEDDNFCNLDIEDNIIRIEYFNQNTGECKSLKLTIKEIEDDNT